MDTTQTTDVEFLVIPDNCVFNIWECQDTGKEVSITPDWYEQNGTPITPETGQDMVYLRTEINHTDYNKAVLQLAKKEGEYPVILYEGYLNAERLKPILEKLNA